jgi:hypothetical protein
MVRRDHSEKSLAPTEPSRTRRLRRVRHAATDSCACIHGARRGPPRVAAACCCAPSRKSLQATHTSCLALRASQRVRAAHRVGLPVTFPGTITRTRRCDLRVLEFFPRTASPPLVRGIRPLDAFWRPSLRSVSSVSGCWRCLRRPSEAGRRKRGYTDVLAACLRGQAAAPGDRLLAACLPATRGSRRVLLPAPCPRGQTAALRDRTRSSQRTPRSNSTTYG